ncbi:uncharacterized protein L969DRAFT_29568, partial [Mixia osmundae IAM 14324]|uniref:uncharacterized protein n=1 Tax=Mixia osmundae (strain CBS 9802 / IAM 14324 / JCM 22182 / KY 12970) TaxID=764103 RepID=UPI0004A556F2
RTEIDPDKFVYSGYIAHPLQTVNVVPGSDTFNRIIRGCCAAVWALDFSACLPDRSLYMTNPQTTFVCGPAELGKMLPTAMTDCTRIFPKMLEGECQSPTKLEAIWTLLATGRKCTLTP